VVNKKNIPVTITMEEFYSMFPIDEKETVKDMPSIYSKRYEILFEFDEETGMFIGLEILQSDK